MTICQESKIDQTVSYSLPDNVEIQSTEKLQSFLKSRNKSLLTTKKFPGRIYRFGDILLTIVAGQSKTEANYLEVQKKAFDRFYANPGVWKNYTSEIRSSSNYSALIRRHDLEDYSYYDFVAIDTSHTKGLSGRMEYKKSDEAKAKQLMEALLKKLKFK